MKNLPRHEVKDLLNRIANGDDTACARLYSVYQSGLFAYVRYRVWSDAGAEEGSRHALHGLSQTGGVSRPVRIFNAGLGIANNKIREWRRQNVKYTREIAEPTATC